MFNDGAFYLAYFFHFSLFFLEHCFSISMNSNFSHHCFLESLFIKIFKLNLHSAKAAEEMTSFGRFLTLLFLISVLFGNNFCLIFSQDTFTQNNSLMLLDSY